MSDYFYARTGLNIIDTRWRTLGPVDALQRESLDFYAAVRSLYRQRRNSEINNAGRENDLD